MLGLAELRCAKSAAGSWPVLCAGVGTLTAVGVFSIVPLGGDAAAHLYRALLVQHGYVFWDNFWYGGQYPLASYSLLYYWPAALLGNAAVAVAAVAVASALFAMLAAGQWGPVSRLSAGVFAVTAGLVPATGQYPFLLGTSCALLTLVLLQRRRPLLAGLLAGVTAGCSLLAFFFLLLVLAAVAIARRQRPPRAFLLVGFVGVLVTAVGANSFGAPWVAYPFALSSLVAGLLLAIAACVLAWRAPQCGIIATLLGLWAVASLLLYLLPNPVGADVLRLREFVLPLVVLAFVIGGRRCVLPGLVALGLSLLSLIATYQPAYAGAVSGGNDRMALWRPALGFLRHERVLGFRIEAVPTAGHWEAYYLPRAGYPIARGWYRQLDLIRNQVLYSPVLTAAQYRGWLSANAVSLVLLPHRIGLDGRGAEPEAALLSSGRSGLREVFDSAGWTAYAVPHPTPILSGPEASAITGFGHTRIEGWLAGPGRYRLLVNYTPSFTSSSSVCVGPGPHGTTTLVAAKPGPFRITISVESLTDGPARCTIRGARLRSRRRHAGDS